MKVSNIDVYTQKKADGSEVTVLRNSTLGKYVQISEQGLFMWDLLDGESSIKDIALQLYLQFKFLMSKPSPATSSIYIKLGLFN